MAKKVLYGICGIGTGHFYKQKPLIDLLLAQNWEIHFFAFESSLELCEKFYGKCASVKISKVCSPYLPTGVVYPVDYDLAAKVNDSYDVTANFRAFNAVQIQKEHPCLVISDYEPNSVALGYYLGIPVVTIDQQSKFFSTDTFPTLDRLTCINEVGRLRMFFPVAKRFACSFFPVTSTESVQIIQPFMRQEIKETKKLRATSVIEKNLVCYFSSQHLAEKSVVKLCSILDSYDGHVDVFVPDEARFSSIRFKQIKFHGYDESLFLEKLKSCEGVVSTAGHNLLSECVYLGIPVYACPLKVYEQKINAHKIQEMGMGLVASDNFENFAEFMHNVENYSKNSSKYASVLPECSLTEVYSYLESVSTN